MDQIVHKIAKMKNSPIGMVLELNVIFLIMKKCGVS